MTSIERGSDVTHSGLLRFFICIYFIVSVLSFLRTFNLSFAQVLYACKTNKKTIAFVWNYTYLRVEGCGLCNEMRSEGIYMFTSLKDTFVTRIYQINERWKSSSDPQSLVPNHYES